MLRLRLLYKAWTCAWTLADRSPYLEGLEVILQACSLGFMGIGALEGSCPEFVGDSHSLSSRLPLNAWRDSEALVLEVCNRSNRLGLCVQAAAKNGGY